MADSDAIVSATGISATGDALADTTAWHARHAEQAGAPVTARVVRAVPAIASSNSATGRRIAGWVGLTVEDALQFRVAGGIHFLHLTGEEERLAPIYAGLLTDQAAIDALLCEVVERFDHMLLPWLDNPPQTNEAARSASIIAALLWLAGRVPADFALFELGASGGANTMMGRYRFDLGGVKVGPSLSRMVIAPEWRGSPPPENQIAIVAASGCDRAPLDLTDPAQANKLRAYVWPEMTGRMARLDTAIAIAERSPPDIARMDAGDFVTQMLAGEQKEGTTNVLFHTVVWQYLPQATRDAITAAMEAAGAEATPERPLAWVQLETNRETFRHDLTVRWWNGENPDCGKSIALASAHPQGNWVEWKG